MRNNKTIISLLLSATLFFMPIGAFFVSPNNVMPVYAENGIREETRTGENGEGTNTIETPVIGNTEESTAEEERGEAIGTEESTDTGENTTEESTMGEPESTEPSSTISESKVELPTCICTDKCVAYEKDIHCEVCRKDYTKCEYLSPKVKISILEPDGWHRNGGVDIKIRVIDTLYSGNFEISKVEARIGQNGRFMDITDTMHIRIIEDCSIYIQVTDTKGKTYLKNRNIQCFDKDKPTLNAGISSGMLTIQASDNTSGVSAIYVNGQEFTELTDGTLHIRLQQFDSTYENFSIQAMDHAGNVSSVYTIKNPYYKDPFAEQKEESPIPELPESTLPTNRTNAKASVTNYVNTAEGCTENPTTKKQGSSKIENISNLPESENTEKKERAEREFYTIQTDNEKVFYLIIDNTKDSNNVYFLTEISENDLLNVTGITYTVMEQKAEIVESRLPNEELEKELEAEETSEKESAETGENIEESDTEIEQETEEKEMTFIISYIFLGVIGAVVIVVLYFFKIYHRKGEDFVDDDEDMEEELYENEDEGVEKDFFNQMEDSEN